MGRIGSVAEAAAGGREVGVQSLADRVAVVTGAASGIGLGIARACAKEGMHLVLADLPGERLDAAAASLREAGTRAIAVPTDVSSLASVEALAKAALAEYGAVHALFNNAGISVSRPIDALTLDDWEWVLGVDLWGPIYGVHVFLPIIEQQDWGHISSTASISGLVAGAAAGAYNVAKHGVVALMATLERELRARKSPVRASVLCPGPINTDIGRNSVALRRERMGKSPATAREGNKLGDKLARLLAEQGMAPDRVGEIVLRAILEEKFWIFTHPGLNRHAEEQLELMLRDQTLSRGALV